jgi:hypothetical protein
MCTQSRGRIQIENMDAKKVKVGFSAWKAEFLFRIWPQDSKEKENTQKGEPAEPACYTGGT